MKLSKLALLSVAVVMGGSLVSWQKKTQERRVVPPAVVTEFSVDEMLPQVTKEYVGHVRAKGEIPIPARISGIIEKMNFNDGDMVRKGDLLFEIEDDEYVANVAAAQALVDQYKAELEYAETNFKRQNTLAEKNATARASKDDAVRLYHATKAKLAEAEAKLMSAKIELGYTKIYAEIDGRMGKATYSPGNYVTPSSNPLVTLVQVTPVNIRFPVSERDLLTMFGSVKGVREKAELRIRTADGKMHDGWTELLLVDNKTDTSTGTIAIWFSADNTDQKLIPGGFVTVYLSEKTPDKLPFVPNTAVMTDRKGNYVYVLDGENKVSRRDVELGPLVELNQTIASGLKKGERVVATGTHKTRPGLIVAPANAPKAAPEKNADGAAAPSGESGK